MTPQSWRQLVSDLLSVDSKVFQAEHLENYRFALSRLLKAAETLAISTNELSMVNFCHTCVLV